VVSLPRENEKMLLSVLDHPRNELERFAHETDWPRLMVKAAEETARRVTKACPPPASRLERADASEYLECAIAQTQMEIIEQHRSGYGAVRWLWYLRRAPRRFFEGSYHTTLAYDLGLAELLSAQFERLDVSQSQKMIAFRVDAAAVRYLAQYIGRIKHLSSLHQLYRRVGKGGVLDTTDPFLHVEVTEATQEAIEIYDQRHDRSQDFSGGGLGMVSIEPDFRVLSDASRADDFAAFLVQGVTPPVALPLTYPDGAGGLMQASVTAYYMIEKVDVSKLLSPLGADGHVPGYLSSAAGAIQLLMLLPAIAAHVPWFLSSVCMHGYAVVGERRLQEIVDAFLPELSDRLAARTSGFKWPRSFADWLRALREMRGSTWPMAVGNVLRCYQDNWLLDLSAASNGLLHRVELERSPHTGNQRAELFELECQALIDGSPWSPAASIRDLRGRNLRRDAKTLTDVDAIGVKGTTLMLVSCKSVIYDRAYDRGAFQVVRNAQSTVDAAVEAWRNVVDDFCAKRRGDNFDFSSFEEIIGVVCTPFPVYSDRKSTLSELRPGLRACCSAGELGKWLLSEG